MSVIIVNTEKITHYSIKEYCGLVTANQVVGANFIADIFAGFTDVFGGKSGAYREQLDVLYKDVKNQLSEKAKALGANAVVGLKIEFDEISGKGKSMFMVTAIGTAIIIEPDRYEIYDKLHKLSLYFKDGLLNQEQYNFEKDQIEKANENFLANVVKKRAELLDEKRKCDEENLLEEEIKRSSLWKKNRIKEAIADNSDKLWMLSPEGINSAEVPYTLKGNSMDEVIINLIAEAKFNEAGKYYMEEVGADAESAYDYIYSLFEESDEI